MSALTDELANDPFGLGLKGAAPEIALAILNRAGTASVEGKVVSLIPMDISRAALTMCLGNESIANVQDFKESEAGKAFKFLWELPGEVDMTLPKIRDMISGFAQANLITEDERDAVLALGMVDMSRAQELLGRPATLEDVINA
ncbi:MAG: hypothetical protein FD177_211 [Desulfovibrionaceae bacterium]|nr:MAG: hypothetical protein FD177_211 [Desulfovibrionaceae bacterium]